MKAGKNAFRTKLCIAISMLCVYAIYNFPNLNNDEDLVPIDEEGSLQDVSFENETQRINLFLKKNKGKCTSISVNKSEFESILKIPESDCSSPYVEVHDGGRLGNQICQYMSLWLFRKQFGVRVLISSKTYNALHKYFPNISIPHGNNKCFNSTSVTKGSFSQIYRNFIASSKYLKNHRIKDSPLIKGKNYIKGAPCESNLISSYREELHSEFQLSTEILTKAATLMNSILKKANYTRENVTLVSVHVRRTDYIKYTRDHFQLLPDRKYFLRAIDSCKARYDNAVFAVFSDDIKWCKENLKGPDVIYPGRGDVKNPILDFALISLCDHHVIGLGTYSYTSAFLGNGSIIYGVSEGYVKSTNFRNLLCNQFFTPVLVS